MDVLAEDADNKLYEIEIQKADDSIAHEKRMLYYASTIINDYFFKGDQKYDSVPELHTFYISKKEGLATMDDFSKKLYNAGMNDGETKEKFATVKRMLKLGKNSLTDIAEMTELPLATIKQIQAKM